MKASRFSVKNKSRQHPAGHDLVTSAKKLSSPTPSAAQIRVAVPMAVPVLTLAVAGASNVLAQTDTTMEEVIVSATRRDTTLQETPFNISAVSGTDLEKAGVLDLGDLLRRVPGVAYLDQGGRVGGNNPNIILRGINANPMIGGFDFPNVAVAPISVYVNETPVFFPIRLDDLDRVEVLRGPQGTLYGSGSMGGTLKLLTRRPDPEGTTLDLRGSTFWTAESDEQSYTGSATLNLPMTDTLSLRITAGIDRLGGFIDAGRRYDLAGDGAALPLDPSDPVNSAPTIRPITKDINETESQSIRASVRYQPNDKIDAVLSFHRQSDESGGRQVQNPFFGSGEDYVEYKAADEPYERDVDLASLEVDVDFGFATLTSASSVYKNESDQSVDYTDFWVTNVEPYYYSAFPRVVSPERSTTDDEGFIQEFRLRSSGTGRLDWLVGAYYSDVETSVVSLYTADGASAWNDLPRGPDDPPPYFFANNTDVNAFFDRTIEIVDLAVFGEVTYRITDQWQITGGARAFKVDFEQDLVEALPQCGYYCASDGVDPNGSILLNVTEEDSDVTLKANTSYELSDTLMVFATWIEGYRRGGGNVALLNHPFFPDPPELLTFDPDSAENWEIGVKGQIDGRIQYTATAYYIDWDSPQIDSFTPFGNPAVVNGEGARTQGIEFELFGSLTDRLDFSVGYAYTDAELTDDFETPEGGVGLSGESLPGVPEHLASMTLDYTMPLPGDLFSTVRYSANGFYRSETNSDFQDSVRFFEIDAFSLWDLSATLTSASGDWSVTAFVDNVTNEEGVTGGIPAARNGPIGQFFFVTRPRNFGLRFSYSFH